MRTFEVPEVSDGRNGWKEWIDVLKGIGILSVVVGHVLDCRYVFAFHMPLFFMISGYLFHVRQNVMQYMITISRRLLLPYLSFLITFNLFTFVVSGKRLGIYNFFYGGNHIVGIYAVFWYITVLYLSLILFNLLKKYEINATVSLLLCLIIGYVLQYENVNCAWNAQVVPMAISYMLVGNTFKENPLRECPATLLFVVILSFMAPLVFPEVELDMKKTDYGVPLVSFVISCLMCLGLYFISHVLCKMGGGKNGTYEVWKGFLNYHVCPHVC